jgi:hypothetical protein
MAAVQLLVLYGLLTAIIVTRIIINITLSISPPSK